MTISLIELQDATTPGIPSFALTAATEKAVRDYLAANPPAAPITTTRLVEAIWPAQGNTEGRHKFIDRVLDLADNLLSDCATRGPKITRVMYGKQTVTRPWYWHAPKGTSVAKTCPKCGAEIE